VTTQKPATQTKTFLEYMEYELSHSYLETLEVPTRDVQTLDFAKLSQYGLPVSPTEFRFFDADVTVENGREVRGVPRNFSADYRVADIVMSLEDYKKREFPKLEEFKKNKLGRLSAFLDELLVGGFSLKRAFKAALGPKHPVRDGYIKSVESQIAEAEKIGATHVALRDHDLSYPVLVTRNMVVLDKTMKQQLHPAMPKPRPAPAGPGEG